MGIYMIDSFKNFERLRYRLSKDMREIASDNKENSDSLRGQIANTVFATIFSAFITNVAFNNDETGYNVCMVLKMIGLFVVLYIISYTLYKFLYDRIKRKWEERMPYSIDSSMSKKIQIQKDFDNIACDSILMARGYRNAFKELEEIPENKTLKVFYYYEIMHYLDVACIKTKRLVEYKESCIRTIDKAIGVDIFRVVNIEKMMQELDVFLVEEFSNICDDENQIKAVQYQQKAIKKKIEYIKNNI